ncbi:MAG TPA: GDP-mannose 4,6-dehydratase [Anaerolineae bacterium]|nr:GDP-mannose 4,6-dehydratase [Anaerolineae bacterium]
MRALVTGITGFAGGHLTQILVERGDEVFGVSRQHDWSQPHLRQIATLVTIDLRDPDATRQLLNRLQPEVVYHLAGQAFVPEAWANPWGTMENNIRPQLNLIEAILKLRKPIRLLIVTSNEIYGQINQAQLPVNEETPLRPHNPYGVSKAAQDLLALQFYLSHHIDVLRARAFNHIGPRQSPFFVASSFAKQIAEIEHGLSQPVLRVGNLEAQRDFTDVVDVVRAYALLVEHGQAGEAYNIGTGRAHSIQSLLDTLLSLSDHQIQVEPDPQRMRPSDNPIIYADNRKLCTQTGWQPTLAFEESLKRILNYWRDKVRTQT